MYDITSQLACGLIGMTKPEAGIRYCHDVSELLKAFPIQCYEAKSASKELMFAIKAPGGRAVCMFTIPMCIVLCACVSCPPGCEQASPNLLLAAIIGRGVLEDS